MKGIILGIIPSESNFVEVKLPINVTPEQFDLIMNRIKFTFYSQLKPELEKNGADLTIATFSEEEANEILSESPAILALESLIKEIGNPFANPDWSAKFWKAYGEGNPIVGLGLNELRLHCTPDVEKYLAERNLSWLVNFVRATAIR